MDKTDYEALIEKVIDRIEDKPQFQAFMDLIVGEIEGMSDDPLVKHFVLDEVGGRYIPSVRERR